MTSFALLLCVVFSLTAAFEVHDKSSTNGMSDRTYYIACVEDIWDYAPYNMNKISGMMIMSPYMHAGRWLYGTDNSDTMWIGSKYYKAMYREYTDDTFTMQYNRTESNEGRDLHLGIAGPAIRAIVGERVRIVYKNMCSFSTTMHAHGVLYEKTSEGAPYMDSDMTTAGDTVAENGNFTYFWDFREGMVDKFSSSKMWLYHSHVVEDDDVHTGLIGPIIVTKSGDETSNTDLRPIGIDYEYVAFFIVFDESESHLFSDNVAAFSNESGVNFDDEDYIESNLMHAINGYVYGNSDAFVMTQGNKVRWYVASFGNEADGPHSPHWHGNNVESLGEYVDTINLIPASTLTVDMKCDNAGKWLFHCHVNHHIHAGMMAYYEVIESNTTTTMVDITTTEYVGYYGYDYAAAQMKTIIISVVVVALFLVICLAVAGYFYRRNKSASQQTVDNLAATGGATRGDLEMKTAV